MNGANSHSAARPTPSEWLARLETEIHLSDKHMAEARAALSEPGGHVERANDRLVSEGRITEWQGQMLQHGLQPLVLGDYLLLDMIGAGGMSSVYRARHRKSDRIVALKVLSNDATGDPNAMVRFRREIKLASQLDHPNIVAAYDADFADGRQFLVMELVAGMDLSHWVERHGKLPLDFACECARQAALGLQHAFEMGLVHRDVKPANLIVTWNERAGSPLIKLLDMGLARFISESSDPDQLTQTGQFMGTPEYVSPEQSLSARRADIRSDIYSLGCTLFRLLTGELPFAGENPIETIVARSTQDPPALRTRLPSAPPGLEAVVKKMMSRDPKARFATPVEVADALAPFIGALWAEGVPAEFLGTLRPKRVSLETERVFPRGTVPAARWAPPRPPRRVDQTGGAAASPNARTGTPPGAGRPPSGLSQTADVPPRPVVGRIPAPPTARVLLPALPPTATPAEAVHGPWPTLVVGIGRTGVLALEAVRGKALDLFSNPSLCHVALLGIDTDEEVLRDSDENASSQSDRTAQMLYCRFRKPTEYLTQWDSLGDIASWMNPETMQRIPRAGGAGGQRALGRLASTDHSRRILTRIANEMQKLHIRATQAEGKRVPAPRVVVVAAMGGGTGSGMFLDVCRLARQAFSEVQLNTGEVAGVLIAGVQANEAERNARIINHYALLEELLEFNAGESVVDALEVVDATAEQLPFPRLEAALEIVGELIVHRAGTPFGKWMAEAERSQPWSRYQSVGAVGLEYPGKELNEKLAAKACRKLVGRWVAPIEPGLVEAAREGAVGWMRRTYNPEGVLQLLLKEYKTDSIEPIDLEEYTSAKIKDLAAQLLGRSPPAAPAAAAECKKLVDEIQQLFKTGSPVSTAPPAAADGSTIVDERSRRIADSLLSGLFEQVKRQQGMEPNLQLAGGVLLAAINFLGEAAAQQSSALQTAQKVAQKAAAAVEASLRDLAKASGWGLGRSRSSANNAVRQFLLATVELALAERTGQFYFLARSTLSEISRELVPVRQCVERVLERLHALEDKRLDQRSGLRPRTMVLPTADAEGWFKQIEETTAGLGWQDLQLYTDAADLATVEGVWKACRGNDDPSGDLTAGLLMGAVAWLQRLLPPNDVAQILLMREASSDAEPSIRFEAVLAEAKPSACRFFDLGLETGYSSVREHCFAALPDGDAGSKLFQRIAAALPRATLHRFFDSERCLVCRLYASDSLRDVTPGWILAAQPAYEAACKQRRSPRVYPIST